MYVPLKMKIGNRCYKNFTIWDWGKKSKLTRMEGLDHSSSRAYQ